MSNMNPAMPPTLPPSHNEKGGLDANAILRGDVPIDKSKDATPTDDEVVDDAAIAESDGPDLEAPDVESEGDRGISNL